MKSLKFSAVFLCFLTFITVFTGCRQKQNNNADKIKVACSIFPELDWTFTILGYNTDSILPSMIIQNGMDIHNYQPNQYDFDKIKTADLIIYIGGDSENWLKEAIKTTAKPDVKTLNLLETLNSITQTENTDEHIWLSLRNAQILTIEIAKALQEIDPTHNPIYLENAKKYNNELKLLDMQFQKAVDNAKQRTIIFSDRFPFYYLFKDYNLDYISALPGCSSQTQIDEQTLETLAAKVNELNVKYIYKIETASKKRADKILSKAHNYDCEIISLDSLQSSTVRSALEGKTYIKTMKTTLQDLEKGLQ